MRPVNGSEVYPRNVKGSSPILLSRFRSQRVHMNGWIGPLTGIGIAAWFALTAGAATCDSVTAVADPAVASRAIVASMQPIPEETLKPMEVLFTFAADPTSTFHPRAVKPLVDFLKKACVADSGWKLPDRDGAEGSAYVVKMKVPLSQYLALNFHPGIPDYAVFQSSLRYSACLDSNEMQRAYACIETGPTGVQDYVFARMTGMEEITPNPESGSYFSYTNSRVFVRCKVDGRDVVFSLAETIEPSTLSLRGVPVGPQGQALFFYSGKPGLNMRGMTWMLSQIRRSTTLSICVALGSNETAVTTFAWLDAGWKGMNVTRSEHILNSQINTLEFARRIVQDPHISAPLIASLVDAVNGMSPSDVDADYEKYLSYIRIWRDQGRQKSYTHVQLLRDLYDQAIARSVPLPHRRALLVQERIRAWMGIPSWSTRPGVEALVSP